MGYIEKILGDNERVVYRTHQHFIVLLGRVLGTLFAFLVFLALGLVVLLPSTGDPGNRIRQVVGVIALGSLVMPLYLIVSAWLSGLRGGEFIQRIWRAALAGLLILAVAVIMLLVPNFWFLGWIAIIVCLVPAFEVVRIFLDWLNERYIITNRRVMEIKGTINKHVRDSALEKVNDVEMDQSIIGRLLGYGTVQIITGSDIGINMFRRISNPVRFKRAMLNAKEELHVTPSDEIEATPALAVPTPDKGDIPDLIAELDELRQKGIISEEEFQTKKAELLARL